MSRSLRPATACAALFLLAAGFAGCAALLSDRTPAIPPGQSLSQATPEALLDLLSERSKAVVSISSVAKLRVVLTEDASQAEEKRFSTSQAVLAKAPASFRLESLSPFGVSYAVVSDGAQLAVLAPQEGTIYRGVASAGTVANATGVDAAPGDITQILLGLPPLPRVEARLAWISSTPEQAQTHDGRGALEPAVLLHAPSAERPGETVIVGLARLPQEDAAIVPVLFERIAPDGRLELRARFGAYQAVGQWSVPTSIELWAPGSHATLDYRDVELNPEVGPERFRLVTPSGMRDLPLQDGRGIGS
jgi:outer membrane lipoprotein-sorting protein